MHLFYCKKTLYSKIITIIDDFVGHRNWIDTCDDRIQLYWECTNSTLPSIVESIWFSLITGYPQEWDYEIFFSPSPCPVLYCTVLYCRPKLVYFCDLLLNMDEISLTLIDQDHAKCLALIVYEIVSGLTLMVQDCAQCLALIVYKIVFWHW